MIDVLVGWAYVGMTFLVVGLAERGWAAVRARRAATPADPAVAGPPHPAPGPTAPDGPRRRGVGAEQPGSRRDRVGGSPAVPADR